MVRFPDWPYRVGDQVLLFILLRTAAEQVPKTGAVVCAGTVDALTDDLKALLREAYDQVAAKPSKTKPKKAKARKR